MDGRFSPFLHRPLKCWIKTDLGGVELKVLDFPVPIRDLRVSQSAPKGVAECL